MPSGLLSGEFSDAAFGVAAEVSLVVARSLIATGRRFHTALCWEMAANLLRGGWQRGHRLMAHEIGQGQPS